MSGSGHVTRWDGKLSNSRPELRGSMRTKHYEAEILSGRQKIACAFSWEEGQQKLD